MNNLQLKEELRVYLQDSFLETSIKENKLFVSSLAEKIIRGDVKEAKK